MHAPNIIVFVLDISSRLKATEFYIQSREKTDTKAMARGEGIKDKKVKVLGYSLHPVILYC